MQSRHGPDTKIIFAERENPPLAGRFRRIRTVLRRYIWERVWIAALGG